MFDEENGNVNDNNEEGTNRYQYGQSGDGNQNQYQYGQSGDENQNEYQYGQSGDGNQNQYQYGQNNAGNQSQYQYNNAYNQNMYQEPGKSERTGFGIASMVLGIIALVMFCSCINIPLAILSIIFGILQLTQSSKKGMALAGLITSGISIVLTIALYAFVFATNIGIYDELYDEIYQEIYEYDDLNYNEHEIQENDSI